jgi:hypothetical protein
MHRQQWAAARQYLEEGLNIHPDHPALTNALIRILAACPVDSIRDGNRAVTLGRHRFEAEASLSSLEAYAMALAETGRFEEAAQLQQQGIAAARQAGRNDLLPTLTQNLLLYQSRQPARTP